MAFELDHLFVFTDIGAPVADRLVDLGMTEGTRTTHPGQGTSNRRFFFHNMMLELAWVHDEAEAKSAADGRLRFFHRWRDLNDGACPFGLIFRSTDGSDSPPFSSWPYTPSYMPPSVVVHVGTNADVSSEPMLFYIASAPRPDQVPNERRQPIEHAIGLREITRVRWIRPDVTALSAELTAVAGRGIFSVGAGPAHALEIGFDHERSGKSQPLKPELPVTLFW
jgi:hypothetical protein